jgi:hypothetical protein
MCETQDEFVIVTRELMDVASTSGSPTTGPDHSSHTTRHP